LRFFGGIDCHQDGGKVVARVFRGAWKVGSAKRILIYDNLAARICWLCFRHILAAGEERGNRWTSNNYWPTTAFGPNR
jgi:hypothetical protein